MKVAIRSIDNLEASGSRYSARMEADIEFYDESLVAKEIGVETCVEAFSETDVYTALGGWVSAKEYYADEIEAATEEAIETRLAELAKESETVGGGL